MKLNIRTTKFPYFFWGFNKAYLCELDFKKNLYYNLEANTEYEFKSFNSYIFLFLKFFPLIIVFYLTFSVYDFYPHKNTITAYILALFLSLVINLLENLARKIGIIFLIAFALLLSFLIKDFFLVAYVLKYFILFSVFIIFYLDTKEQAFSIIKNNKVVSHFLISKTFLKDNYENKKN